MPNNQKRNKTNQKPKNNKKKPLQNKTEDPFFTDGKRTTYEIYAKMLQICQNPQNKTRIMYKTNTSYTSFKKYLQQLQQKNLLQKENTNKYQMTQRGKMFLEKYSDLKKFLTQKDP